MAVSQDIFLDTMEFHILTGRMAVAPTLFEEKDSPPRAGSRLGLMPYQKPTGKYNVGF